MKTGSTMEALASRILNEHSAKRDYIASTRSLVMTDSGRMRFTVGETPMEFEATGHALRQIGERVQIPAKYMERMMAQAPELMARNVNHWFASNPEKRMVRTLQNGTNKVRAFLSNSYRPLDNYDLAENIIPKLTRAGCEIKSCELTETRLYLQAVTQKISKELWHANNIKVGDVVQAGVCISNSEVGMGAIRVEPLVFRVSCLNGAIIPGGLAKYHTGKSNGMDIAAAEQFFTDATRRADDKAFWMKVNDVVDAVLNQEQFDLICRRFEEASKHDLGDPLQVVENTANRFNLLVEEKNSVLTHLVRGGDLTQFGLIQAVTRTAEDLKDYDRAIEFERMGGQILELPPSEFSARNN